MLQVLLRIKEAVMKRPQENQRKDSFAESLASILFRVGLQVLSFNAGTHWPKCLKRLGRLGRVQKQTCLVCLAVLEVAKSESVGGWGIVQHQIL